MTKQQVVEDLYVQFQETQRDIDLHKNQLDYIDPNNHYAIDAIIYELKAAEVRFESVVRQLKEYSLGGKAV